MDALALDISTPQQLREDCAEIEDSVKSAVEPSPSSSSSSSSSREEDYYREGDLALGDTVPVGEDDRESSREAAKASSSSRSSTSSSSSSSSFSPATLYQAEFLTPKITYGRDFEQQKLIAIIGREFDTPSDIASSLQRLIPKARRGDTELPVAKLVPFTVRRKVLLKGLFDSQELKKHDLICMCYNASEARIMLTGTDGYYTSLLKHTEAILGQNKAAFLVTNYVPPLGQPAQVSADSHLVSAPLKARLHNQQPLRHYLEQGQVLSWNASPSESQALRLVTIASLEPNPQGLLGAVGQQCNLL